jgi:hypothetical protein
MAHIEGVERTVQLVVIAGGGDWSPRSWDDDPPWGRVCRVIRKACSEGEADALRLHLNYQAQRRGDRGWAIKAPVGAPLKVGSVCARIFVTESACDAR